MKLLARVVIVLLALNFLLMCNRTDAKRAHKDETILKGKVNILVDETLLPIIQDEKQVFESEYDAKIILQPRSESEAIQALIRDSASIIILSRNLNKGEKDFFSSRKRFPKVTPFATDAIALVANRQRVDSTITVMEILEVLKGNPGSSLKGLVFDNLNSGTIRYMMELAKVDKIPTNGVYSFKNNAQVLKFVSENPGMIGVVGINWIVQPTPEIKSYLKDVKVLNVEGLEKKGFYAPTQNNLAEGTYPLARKVFFINVQGYDGLGMGFASFIAGDRGQRIILQSGLLPHKIPPRKILTRKTL